jgi:hypothetical protein
MKNIKTWQFGLSFIKDTYPTTQPGQPYKVEPEIREAIVQNILDEPFSVVKSIATEHGVHATTIAR